MLFRSVSQSRYSFTIYSCGDRSRPQAQAMVFLLYNDKRLSENGRKIGIPSDDCTDPTEYNHQQLNEKWSYIVLDTANPETLQKYWIKMTPKSVYEANLEWWKKP